VERVGGSIANAVERMRSQFTESLWQDGQPIWQRIVSHPFIRQLRDDSLPVGTFRFYLIQDYHYLEGFARAVAIALAGAPDSDTLETLSKRLLTPIERPLHERLFRLAALEAADVRRATVAPTNLAYQNHMLATAAHRGVAATTAALLPCPWTYQQLGSQLGDLNHPIYREWGRFYSEGLLTESCAAWRALVDQHAEEASSQTRERMRRAFMLSFRYEYMFWDMAYGRERWATESRVD
jgi:thiaminase (transcriptional activator TenA)